MKHSFHKSIKWSTGIAVITLVLAAIFSVASTLMLSGVSWGMGMVIVLIIVLIGVFFDIIGVASTAANEVPFHAMASEKVPGSRHAIQITRNADRVSNFCNDVIGDISGIISGTASAAVIIELTMTLGHGEGTLFEHTISILFTGIIAAITVGGKAFGKSYAIHHATAIIFQVGRLLYFFEEKLKIRLFGTSSKRGKRRN
ncbi:hypothetical protein QUF84_16875 [Fictibacillus enclensis]|uniref:CNNM transmembrane domain-containing protein n=1 Tax=Fictibacillus enclensis TaxID=1017270 RepID=A0A0V8JF43_9BACL|nr:MULTISPECIES: hypothetical protein [Fictibacillus]KSU85703.1 hypothetical protein AS030_09455 [Fictibacillus enclensis]MDM5199651.1 hypothetical protein [Fictibacillus enclensis]MDM5338890.1 hypothetical protein [Fictibacillus enclensis]RXY98600.1 hypothetical protein DMO16_02355 [Fictibacillus sp. S7]WHY70381.1 hypothetical protein QNH15_15010 [Fictibacillus enclensis]